MSKVLIDNFDLFKVRKQSKGGCGPACLRMILEYHDRKKGNKLGYSNEMLIEMLGCTENRGCDPWDLSRVARKYGFVSEDTYGSADNQMEVLKEITTVGKRPSIVNWFPDKLKGHYEVVLGFYSSVNELLLADPYSARVHRVEIDEFKDRWIDYPGMVPDKRIYTGSIVDIRPKTKEEIEFEKNCGPIL